MGTTVDGEWVKNGLGRGQVQRSFPKRPDTREKVVASVIRVPRWVGERFEFFPNESWGYNESLQLPYVCRG